MSPLQAATIGGTGQSRGACWPGLQRQQSLLDFYRGCAGRIPPHGLPDDLSDCFALPGGTAREFNVRELQVSRSTVTITCGHAASACPWGSVGSLPGAASHVGGGGGGHRYHRERAPPRPTGPWSRARAQRLRLHRQHRSHWQGLWGSGHAHGIACVTSFTPGAC